MPTQVKMQLGFILFCVCSLGKYLLRPYYAPVTALDTGYKEVNTAYILVGETDVTRADR